MRLKRSKQYRKLMQQYSITFGFREPYQVLLDSDIVAEAFRCKMDISTFLSRNLHGEVKPMITQCSMRHLYNAVPKNDQLIEQAKTFERRRCGHHQLDEPLSTLECLSETVDPKDQGMNKHKLVVASQDPQVRQKMRSIPGVPLIYVKKSVMILEPMAGATAALKEREEKGKFRAGISKAGGRTSNTLKRPRDDDDDADQDDGAHGDERSNQEPTPKKKKSRGQKEPNPLSVKKPKAREQANVGKPRAPPRARSATPPAPIGEVEGEAGKKKRKRKPKAKAEQAEANIDVGSED